jgi:fructose-1,6-bisphosphatase/inositol monophosphatase family enzyme
VSIAYERRGRLELAVVFDALKRVLFVAARGCGAAERKVDPRERETVARPRAASDSFPYDQPERRNFCLTFWEAFHDAHAGGCGIRAPPCWTSVT